MLELILTHPGMIAAIIILALLAVFVLVALWNQFPSEQDLDQAEWLRPGWPHEPQHHGDPPGPNR